MNKDEHRLYDMRGKHNQTYLSHGTMRHKDQLSLTNPRDALHHGERAANK